MAIRIQYGPGLAKTRSAGDDPLQALFRQGLALQRQGNPAQAATIYQQVLSSNPEHFDAVHMLGVLAGEAGNSRRAIELLRRAIQLKPEAATAHANLGSALVHAGDLDSGLAAFDDAIKLKRDHASAWVNRGRALYQLRRFAEAEATLRQAVALQPRNADALGDLGAACNELRKFDEALQFLNQALTLKPRFPQALCNRAASWRELRRPDLALQDLAAALNIDVNYADAYANRAAIYSDVGRFSEAASDCRKALDLGSQAEYLLGLRLHYQAKVAQWSDWEASLQDIQAALDANRRACPPFAYFALDDDPVRQRLCGEIWTQRLAPSNASLGTIARQQPGRKIRVGYFSADLHQHATMHLMVGLFERHDRDRFEWTAFSFGHSPEDPMRARARKAFDHFLEVDDRTDVDVARLARERNIDIAVDLKGFTWNSRPGIFAARAAPIQVNYLWYPGTMAADYMDYIVADAVLVPDGARQHYSEKVVVLPGSYQVNDRGREIAAARPSRVDLDLPADGAIFCCFNATYKIAPPVFACWMRILQRVPGSVLWLYRDQPEAERNLRQAAQAAGVDPARLIFAGYAQPDEHLARLSQADLFLDTLPYNAHTTASDALWAGVPVLTCMGRSFASRVASSLLHAIGLPEMVAENLRDYEDLAVALVTDTGRLARLRQKLVQNRLTTPLFDTEAFTRSLERAYELMMRRYHDGLPPDHIDLTVA